MYKRPVFHPETSAAYLRFDIYSYIDWMMMSVVYFVTHPHYPVLTRLD